MPQPRSVARPMRIHDIPPVTPDSVARAKAAAEAERQRDGIELGPDGRVVLPVSASVRMFPRLSLPIPPSGLSRRRTEDCQMAVDAVVEEFGYDACARALRIVAAANGRTL